MKRIASAMVFVAALAGPVFAQTAPAEIHSNHWVFGLPQGTLATNDLIIRNLYALSSNDMTKFADWVAYRLTPREVMGGLDLRRKWRADPWLDDDETLEPSGPDDYKGANDEPLRFERGHLAPLASFKGSVYASEVNYLSNITPQARALNNGPWKAVEEAVRDYVRLAKTVWVMTGPLYEQPMDPLPEANETHIMPSGYWKVVLAFDGQGDPMIAAFAMSQSPTTNDAGTFAVSLNEVDQRTGFQLMPGLTDAAVRASADVGWLLGP